MDINFYKDVKYFNEFSGSFKYENYYDVPEDWFVIITDIKGSTDAVKDGKYKDVNLIGAACIAALRKCGEFPFVFGGDGASFIVPPVKLDEISKSLLKIKNSALSRFSLDLRVGVVPVKDILKKYRLKIAKFRLSEDAYISKFSGGGLEYADQLVKTNEEYLLKQLDAIESNFDGLSCRWKPINNMRGTILTIIIKSTDFSDYSKVQSMIDKVVGDDLNLLNPVKVDHMSYNSISDMLESEKKYEKSNYSLSSLSRKFEIIIAYLIFKTFRSIQPSFLKGYSESLATHSDFRKFDDCLRMVIDCSKSESDEILLALNAFKNVDYGHHLSETALMTCLVDGFGQGQHIHFIDGGSGGYTLAAAKLKNKLKLPV